MSDDDLEVLITLDDPPYEPDEDTFHDGTENSVENANEVHNTSK